MLTIKQASKQIALRMGLHWEEVYGNVKKLYQTYDYVAFKAKVQQHYGVKLIDNL